MVVVAIVFFTDTEAKASTLCTYTWCHHMKFTSLYTRVLDLIFYTSKDLK